jgi:hypothetical protein
MAPHGNPSLAGEFPVVPIAGSWVDVRRTRSAGSTYSSRYIRINSKK